jgi:polar amino acid transport system substrate-binding protein
MFERMNKAAEIEFMRWEEAQEIASKHPEILLLTVFRSDEREPLFNWIGPAFQEQVQLFSLAQHEFGRIGDIASRRDLRVGTQRGNLETRYLADKGFREEENLFEFEDTGQLIQALFNRRVDAIPMGKLQMSHQLQLMQRNPEDLASIFTFDEMSTDLYMTVGRATPQETVRRYREVFRELKQTGEYDRILERWT